jgi:hypothetical protein
MIAGILTLLRMVFIPLEEVVEIEIEIVVVVGVVAVKVDNTVAVGNIVVVVVAVAVAVEGEEGEGRIYHPGPLILVGRGDQKAMTGMEEVLVDVGKYLNFSFFSTEGGFFFLPE